MLGDGTWESFLLFSAGFIFAPGAEKREGAWLIEKRPLHSPLFASEIGAYAAFFTKDKSLPKTV
jgi:hypothetical protein